MQDQKHSQNRKHKPWQGTCGNEGEELKCMFPSTPIHKCGSHHGDTLPMFRLTSMTSWPKQEQEPMLLPVSMEPNIPLDQVHVFCVSQIFYQLIN